MSSGPSDWRKSSYSGNQGGDCVEFAETGHQVHVRDTRNRPLGHLSFPAGDWHSFIVSVKGGEPAYR